ncbi:MAG TPA: aromatic ring-hydroxylating dioxygenase subunit alpha [Novosphingobium sp.]
MANQAEAEIRKVPFAVTRPDRVAAKRYYDPEFYELEKKYLWPKVWQMACRLDEIPNPGDFVVYDNLDQSIIVMRVDANTIKAYHNSCRHRGVALARSSGTSAGGFICPFHGWRWDRSGKNTFVYTPEAFSQDNLCPKELDLVEVRCEVWAYTAFINLDPEAKPLRASLGGFADRLELWHPEEWRVEWWKAARIPCNWKLAMEAFHEGYHVATTHPQLLPPGVSNLPGDAFYAQLPQELVQRYMWTTAGPGNMPAEVDSRAFAEMMCHYMQILSDGMAGMTHRNEIEVAKTLIGMELPKDPIGALKAWNRAANDAVVEYYRKQGNNPPDLNALDAAGLATGVNFAFPHYFLLPTFGSASSYRIRPLGPEECLFELWSLTRYPPDEHRVRPVEPTPVPQDDPSWPPIPAQDYSNLPRQQKGLHTGFDYMRLSDKVEGLISNYQQLIDGYLAGRSREELVEAVKHVSGPIDVPAVNLGFGGA